MAWLALALFLAVVGAATIFTTIRGLRLFRDVKRLLGAVTDAVAELERRAGEAELHMSAAEQASERLSRSLGRLSESRARLSVQLAALQDVRDAVTGVTSVYPSK